MQLVCIGRCAPQMTGIRYQMSRYVLRCRNTYTWTLQQPLRVPRGWLQTRMPLAESRCCMQSALALICARTRISSARQMHKHIHFTWILLQKPRTTTVDDFIARMAPLLDMERDAEVAQVHLAFLPAYPFLKYSAHSYNKGKPCTICRRLAFAAHFFAYTHRLYTSIDCCRRCCLLLLSFQSRVQCMQAGDALARMSPQAAQARGQALLNLRCSQSEGGLLGRTLLTLVSNKVQRLPGTTNMQC